VQLLALALDYLKSMGRPADVMINHVLEVEEAGSFFLEELPAARQTAEFREK